MYKFARTYFALQTLMCKFKKVLNVFTKVYVLYLRKCYRKTVLTCNMYYFINLQPATVAHCVWTCLCRNPEGPRRRKRQSSDASHGDLPEVEGDCIPAAIWCVTMLLRVHSRTCCGKVACNTI